MANFTLVAFTRDGVQIINKPITDIKSINCLLSWIDIVISVLLCSHYSLDSQETESYIFLLSFVPLFRLQNRK